MKKYLLLLSFSWISGIALCQNVGIGTTVHYNTALLHLNINPGTSKGFLITGKFDDASVIPNLGAGSRLMFYPERGAFRAG